MAKKPQKPKAPTFQEQVKKPAEEKDVNFNGKMVWVADDDISMRDLYESILKRRGARVQLFERAEHLTDKLVAIKNGQSSDKNPDAIITDWHFQSPDKTGALVIDASRHYKPPIPVIVMTGMPSLEYTAWPHADVQAIIKGSDENKNVYRALNGLAEKLNRMEKGRG